MGLAFDSTLGAYQIGLILSSVLYGIACNQAYQYFQTYPKDPWIIQVTVVTLLVLETIHSALQSHAAYFWMVINYANPLALSQSPWSLLATSPLVGVIVVVTYSFYSIQIYQLGRKWWLSGLIIVIGLAQLGFCMGCGIVGLRASVIEELTVKKKFLIICASGLGCVGDVVCAGALCYYVYNSRSGFKRTDSLLRRIMIYAIGAGVLTSMTAIAGLVMIILQPLSYIFSTIFSGGTKFYIVSVLARLNSRSPSNSFSVIGDVSELGCMTSSRASNPRLWTTAAEPSDMVQNSGAQGSQAQTRVDIKVTRGVASEGTPCCHSPQNYLAFTSELH